MKRFLHWYKTNPATKEAFEFFDSAVYLLIFLSILLDSYLPGTLFLTIISPS